MSRRSAPWAPHVARSAGAPAPSIVAAFVWTIAVAGTPRRALWAFAVHGALVVLVLWQRRVPVRRVRRSLALDAPFVLFAFALPLIGRGPRTQVLGLSLSTAGLWGMWGVLAKATLGLLVALALVAPLPVADILRGLQQLRVPRTLVAICGLTVRSLHLLRDDLERMRTARIARGSDPRWLWQSRAIATGAGALFVRNHERGERVHLAMVARGYTGAFPALDTVPARRREVATTIAPAFASVLVLVAALATAAP